MKKLILFKSLILLGLLNFPSNAFSQEGENNFGVQTPEAAPADVLHNSSLGNIADVLVGDDFICGITISGKTACSPEKPNVIDAASFRNLSSTLSVKSPYIGMPNDPEKKIQEGSIVRSQTYACGMTVDNELFCWGKTPVNDGNYPMSILTVPMDFVTNISYTKLVMGKNNLCLVTRDSHLLCLGNNVNGQLGANPSSQFQAATIQPHASELLEIVISD